MGYVDLKAYTDGLDALMIHSLTHSGTEITQAGIDPPCDKPIDQQLPQLLPPHPPSLPSFHSDPPLS